MKNKSFFGLSENMASAIAYAGMFVTGILAYILEKENKTVRFHALQSTILFAALGIVTWAAGLLLGWIPLLGGILMWALRAVTVFSWLFLIVTTFKGMMFRVPVLGDIIWEHINK